MDHVVKAIAYAEAIALAKWSFGSKIKIAKNMPKRTLQLD